MWTKNARMTPATITRNKHRKVVISDIWTPKRKDMSILSTNFLVECPCEEKENKHFLSLFFFV